MSLISVVDVAQFRQTTAIKIRARLKQGWARVQVAAFPIAQAAVAGVCSYLLARLLLGHPNPFFAAIVTWISLGFSFNRELRRVAEIAVGVTLGITFGGIVVSTIGSGWWQIGVVLFVSAVLARFLDSGAILTTQAGSQAIVITGYGAAAIAAGPYGRALDTVVGGLVACFFAMLVPGDPRRSLRRFLAAEAAALGTVLVALAEAAVTGDRKRAVAALTIGRSTEPAVRDALDNTSRVQRQARLTLNRQRESELAWFVRQAKLLDQAMRSVRLIARRAPADFPAANQADRLRLGGVLSEFATGANELAAALRTSGPTDAAQARLAATEEELDPALVGDDPTLKAHIVILRTAVVDTLEAAGASPEEARSHLPEL